MTKSIPIRNSRIKSDFKRLLAIVTNAVDEPDYDEVEEIAKRHGLYFDDDGDVREETR